MYKFEGKKKYLEKIPKYRRLLEIEFSEVIDAYLAHYGNGVKYDDLLHDGTTRTALYRKFKKIEAVIDDSDSYLCAYELKHLKPSMNIKYMKTAEKLISALDDTMAKTIGLLAINLVDMGLPTILFNPVIFKYCPDMKDFDVRAQVVEALSSAFYSQGSAARQEFYYTKFFREITGNDEWMSFRFAPDAFNLLNQ